MDDIPKSVILALLFITLLISVLGAWTVLDSMNSKQRVTYIRQFKSSDSGMVSLTVLDPNAPIPPPKVTQATGEVAITVYEPQGGK